MTDTTDRRQQLEFVGGSQTSRRFLRQVRSEPQLLFKADDSPSTDNKEGGSVPNLNLSGIMNNDTFIHTPPGIGSTTSSTTSSPLSSPYPHSPLVGEVLTHYLNLHTELVKQQIKKTQSKTSEHIDITTQEIEYTREQLASKLEKSLRKVDASAGNQRCILRNLKEFNGRFDLVLMNQQRITAELEHFDNSIYQLQKDMVTFQRKIDTQLTELSLAIIRSLKKIESRVSIRDTE